MRPLTTTESLPSVKRKSWRESSYSGKGVSIWAPPPEISVMVMG